ncbi:hypothetical protein [Ligilactobacillus acidipiscis]|uniref:hypothetical protein n=1 Tax=Ligilactobacillus acidipiscis TaxID=89059 RepID=UPI0023F7EDC2|nr:hypothetical protein [Ligilactobacillus acidipiscis]WEV56800.1 hypothetical protein OZX66_11325 [Ligilactobacillus acidipiscis]
MFNKKLRNDAKNELSLAVNDYKSAIKVMQLSLEDLYSERLELQEKIRQCVEYINTIKNKPLEIHTTVKKIQVQMDKFQGIKEAAQKQYDKDIKVAGGSTAAGVAAGVGVAALAPSAAMAIATAVGTASTGTAISTLSGVAATNAALAWLGGGSIAAGGAGIVGGNALIALAGPIGWAIGGSALAGGALMYNGKNKKAAAEMNKKTTEVRAEEKIQIGISSEAKRVRRVTVSDTNDLSARLINVQEYPKDYLEMSDKQKDLLLVFVNNVEAGIQHINWTLGKNHKFGPNNDKNLA